jgi:hypothetical protein
MARTEATQLPLASARTWLGQSIPRRRELPQGGTSALNGWRAPCSGVVSLHS